MMVAHLQPLLARGAIRVAADSRQGRAEKKYGNTFLRDSGATGMEINVTCAAAQEYQAKLDANNFF